MINALLFISVCLNIILAMVVGYFIGEQKKRPPNPMQEAADWIVKKVLDDTKVTYDKQNRKEG